MKVIRPSADMFTEDRPSIFLAGPIQGANDWQDEAINLLEHASTLYSGKDFVVFSPRSLGQVPPYYTQVEWERHHLEHAAKHGVILFWLCNPAKLSWRQRWDILRTGEPSRPHAQTSRLELGYELGTRRGKLAIGMEKGFSNERFIRRLVEVECNSCKIRDYLTDTVSDAVFKL